jgi:importin-5
MCESIGFRDAITYLQPLFVEYMQNETNWRFQYSALMVASQLGVEKAEVEKVGVFVQWAFVAGDHSHPRVRYAAIHMIGQLSDDLNPEFEQIYYESFVALSSKRVHDAVQRVVAHMFASTCNFFEKCEESWKIEAVLSIYLGPIMHCIQNGNTLSIENAISAL